MKRVYWALGLVLAETLVFFSPVVSAAHAGSLYAATDFDYATGSFAGADIVLGYRPNRFYGVEGGYSYVRHSMVNNYGGGTLWETVQGASLDGMGYLPIRRTPFALFGTAGAAYVSASGSLIDAYSYQSGNHSGPAFRAGGGILAALGRHFGIRAMARYQVTYVDGQTDKRGIFTIGFSYNF